MTFVVIRWFIYLCIGLCVHLIPIDNFIDWKVAKTQGGGLRVWNQEALLHLIRMRLTPNACGSPPGNHDLTARPEANKSKQNHGNGSFRKLGVPYFGGPYSKDPTI